MAIVENGKRPGPSWWTNRASRAQILAYVGGLLLLLVAAASPVFVLILDLDEPWQTASIWFLGGAAIFVHLLYSFLSRPARIVEIQTEAARLDLRDQARAGIRTGKDS